MLPEQVIYDYVYSQSESLGFKTYDHLPMESENAPYPFVVIGEISSTDVNLKTALNKTTTLTIHFWGDGESRFKLNEMAEKLEKSIETGYTDGYAVVVRHSQTHKQLIQDTSVPNTVLNHLVLTLVFFL